MTMRVSFTAIALLICASSSLALAAPSVPGRAQIQGDVVKIGQQFHVAGDNVRILSVRWVPGTDQKTVAHHCDVNGVPPNGSLVYQITEKNTWPSAAGITALSITAFYRDGTSVGNETGTTTTANGSAPDKLFPGQGLTVFMWTCNAPQPNKANPVTKLLIDLGHNDSGYPSAYRVLNPVVK